jgi:hypothetical protein
MLGRQGSGRLAAGAREQERAEKGSLGQHACKRRGRGKGGRKKRAGWWRCVAGGRARGGGGGGAGAACLQAEEERGWVRLGLGFGDRVRG